MSLNFDIDTRIYGALVKLMGQNDISGDVLAAYLKNFAQQEQLLLRVSFQIPRVIA